MINIEAEVGDRDREDASLLSMLDISEAQRLAVLHDVRLLDSAPEPAFDITVQLLKQATGVQTALVSLVDADRQWFKARAGLDVCQTPRSAAFCAHTIRQTETLWIEDARIDPRFSSNPLVRGEPHIRFYAGTALTVRDARIGSLCVFDPLPRPFSPEVQRVLESTAASLSDLIERRADGLSAQSLLDHSTDAAVAVDSSGCLTLWNKGAEAMFGWSRQEALGQSLDLILPPDLAGAHWQGFFRYVAGGAPRLFGKAVELTAVRRGGHPFPMELTLARWDHAGQASVGALIRDISPRKAMDLQLSQALVDAKASDRAKSRFLAAMNHEMRTPLNGVLGMGHVLAATALDPFQSDALAMIMESGQHLETLLSDIVAFSAEEAPENTPFFPAAVLTDGLRVSLAAAAAKNIPVELTVADNIPREVFGQEDDFRHIVRCLVDNAVKFTRVGRIVIRLAWTAPHLRLEISDTGDGFDIRRLDDLLKPFEQADNSISRAYDGAGIGLALVDRCVRRWGGHLTADSTIGAGSTFIVDLPVAAWTH